MSRISACIVTYNNADIILRAVESILSWTPDIRIIISDNGSSDSTVSDIKEAYGEDCRLMILENGKNNGYGVGNNLALEYLSSEYHAIINPDIVIRDNVLERMADFMDENPDIAVLSPRIFFPDGGEQLLPKRYPTVSALLERRLPLKNQRSADSYIMLDRNFSEPQKLDIATGCFFFTRTKLLRQVGGFDPGYFMYFEDYDLSLRLAKYGKLLYNPDFIVYHDWNRSSSKSFRYMMIQLFSMVRFFNRWGWKF